MLSYSTRESKPPADSRSHLCVEPHKEYFHFSKKNTSKKNWSPQGETLNHKKSPFRRCDRIASISFDTKRSFLSVCTERRTVSLMPRADALNDESFTAFCSIMMSIACATSKSSIARMRSQLRKICAALVAEVIAIETKSS